MLRIALVEDDAKDRALLEEDLHCYEQQHGERFFIHLFYDGMSFVSEYKADYDLVLMDIEMPHMDGMEAARHLRRVDEETALIFITNMAQYAIKGYEVQALDFMVKPITYGELELKLDRVLRQRSRHRHDGLSLEKDGVVYKVPIRDVQYIEVFDHKLLFHTAQQTYGMTGSLKELEQDARFAGFARCNSCYLVNCEQVTEVAPESIVVGGQRLDISRRRRKAFMQQLTNVMNGGM